MFAPRAGKPVLPGVAKTGVVRHRCGRGVVHNNRTAGTRAKMFHACERERNEDDRASLDRNWKEMILGWSAPASNASFIKKMCIYGNRFWCRGHLRDASSTLSTNSNHARKIMPNGSDGSPTTSPALPPETLPCGLDTAGTFGIPKRHTRLPVVQRGHMMSTRVPGTRPTSGVTTGRQRITTSAGGCD